MIKCLQSVITVVLRCFVNLVWRNENLNQDVPCICLRLSFAFLRTKVGAKSVEERSFIEFGTEEE